MFKPVKEHRKFQDLIKGQIKFIKSIVVNTPIETLIKHDSYISNEINSEIEKNLNFANKNLGGFNYYKIFKKFIKLELEEAYNNSKNCLNDNNKLTFDIAVNCSKECAIVILIVISILEYSFFMNKIELLNERLKKFKNFILKQQDRIEFLKENFELIMQNQFKFTNDDTEIDNNLYYKQKITLKQHEIKYYFKTIYKNHLLI